MVVMKVQYGENAGISSFFNTLHVIIKLSEDSPLVEMESGGCVILGEYICIRKVE